MREVVRQGFYCDDEAPSGLLRNLRSEVGVACSNPWGGSAR